MTHWSGRAQATLPTPLTDQQVEEIVDLLAGFQPTVTITHQPATVAVRLNLEADHLADAAARAALIVAAGLNSLSIAHTLDAVEACTYEALERELAQPLVPELVGMKEIGDMLGVSRQRVYKLAERPDFPLPVQRLAAGAVYARAHVDGFAAVWPRTRTGRPRAA